METTWETIEGKLGHLPSRLAQKYSWLYSDEEDCKQEVLLSAFRAFTLYRDKAESDDHLRNLCVKYLLNDLKNAIKAHYQQKRDGFTLSLSQGSSDEEESSVPEPSYQVEFDKDLYLQEAFSHLREICGSLERRVLDEVLSGHEVYRQALIIGAQNTSRGQSERTVAPSQKALAAALGVTPAAVSQALNSLSQKLQNFVQAH